MRISAHILAAICGYVSIGLTAHADEREQVLADWQQRRERIQSVRYSITGSIEVKPDPGLNEMYAKMGAVLPTYDHPLEIKATILLDLANRRFRIDKREEVFSAESKRWVPQVTTDAYDGKVYQTAVPRDQNNRGPTEPDMCLSTGNLEHAAPAFDYWPIFFAHGIVPTVNAPLRPNDLPIRHELDEFELRGTINVMGRPCTVMRTEPISAQKSLSDEFCIDRGRQSAVVRHVYFAGKDPWNRLDSQFEETPDGWLPKTWACTWTSNGKVERISRFVVESREVNPVEQEDDFTLPIKPGMIVLSDQYAELGSGLDPTWPARATYRVAESGKWVELNSKGFTTIEGVELPPESAWNRIKWWLIGGLMTTVLIVFAGLWLRNHYRRR